MKAMFDHRGKADAVLGKKHINNYEYIYNHLTDLQENKDLPFDGKYLSDNELASNIYQKKYYLKDLNNEVVEHCPEDVFKRVSSFIATTEKTKTKQTEWAQKFYNDLYEGRFLPGGRVIAGAGDLYRLKTLANCFVSKIEKDEIDSIYQAAFECARTYSYGGGIGVDISSLRPKDAVVHNAADSSTGAVSFMELYSLTTGLIGQSGRRGALMLTIDVKHPDIFHFINVKKTPNWVTNQIVEQCKWSGLFDESQMDVLKKNIMENTQVRFANISIKVSDEFMHAVEEQKRFTNQEYIVYSKNNSSNVKDAKQTDKNHYSVEIPSKQIDDYKILKSFTSYDKLTKWLKSEYELSINKDDFFDKNNRDVYGDYICPVGKSSSLAIRQAGDFLLYFSSSDCGEIRELVKAREIWDQVIEGNYKTAEPGLIYWSTMKKYSPSNYVGRPIISTNPCAEVPLEDGGACNLASLNLSRFVENGYEDNATINWDQLADTTNTVVRFLDNVVTWNEKLNALEKQRIAAAETRRLGLGVMGIADMLNQLGLAYDSDEGIEMMSQVMEFIANASFQSSAMLSKEKGPSPIYNEKTYMECPFILEALNDETRNIIRKNGLRNIAIVSIAPTGSISNIILSYKSKEKNYIGISGGVEPIFALYYTRRSESFGNQFFKVFHSSVQAYLDKMNLASDADKHSNISELLPDHFMRTAHNIDPEKRVKIQGICQKYVDHSISSTVNLAEDIEPEVISDVYIDAWKAGLKGITIYRDGSRFPILSREGEATPFQEIKNKVYKIENDDGIEIECSGDEILKMPDGSLTTVYHYMNNDSSVKHFKENQKFEEVT